MTTELETAPRPEQEDIPRAFVSIIATGASTSSRSSTTGTIAASAQAAG